VHTHAELVANTSGTDQSPAGKVLAKPVSSQANLIFWGQDSVVPMSNQAIQPTGGSQPHENCQPFLCVNYIISLFGIFPSPT
jgi:microcystin-dependent protein